VGLVSLAAVAAFLGWAPFILSIFYVFNAEKVVNTA
jgi:hypothetical protein